jgi:hypothetical protein
MPKRRKVLLGLGSLAAGSAAALGTSATSITNSDRNMDVGVVADDMGVLALEDDLSGDLVNQTDNELEIDLAEGGASGVSVGAELILGEINFSSGNATEAAFKVRNQATQPYVLDYSYELENPNSLNSNGSEITFHNFYDTHYNDLEISADTIDSNGQNEVTGFLSNYSGLGVGDAVDFAVHVDTSGSNASVNEDLSGQLTISARPF